MVEIAIASLPHIQATLNYVAATGEKLVSYACEPPPGVPLSTVHVEGHATIIHDLRPARRNSRSMRRVLSFSRTEARSRISGTKRKSSGFTIPSLTS